VTGFCNTGVVSPPPSAESVVFTLTGLFPISLFLETFKDTGKNSSTAVQQNIFLDDAF
jgi:hypothetical protein